MVNPSGKKRRLRRSFPVDRESESDRQFRDIGRDDRPGAPNPLSKCQRCHLPIIGGVAVMKLENGEQRQDVVLCEPCCQSLHKWLSLSGRGNLEQPRRRKRQSDVTDSLISRRRSRLSKKLDRYMSESQRKTMLSALIAAGIGVGVLVVILAIAYIAQSPVPIVQGR
jgi:hypothetical protein